MFIEGMAIEVMTEETTEGIVVGITMEVGSDSTVDEGRVALSCTAIVEDIWTVALAKSDDWTDIVGIAMTDELSI